MDMDDFSAQARACAQDVEHGLAGILSSGWLDGPGPAPARLVAAMAHGALGGGKRLRPLLVRQAAAIFGVEARASLPAV